MDFELGQIRKTVKTKDISTTFVQYGGNNSQFSNLPHGPTIPIAV